MSRTEKANQPEWLSGQKINEAVFVSQFLQRHPMLCCKGVLYDENGIVPEEDAIQKEIYELVKTHVTTGLANKCRKLLEAIRLACRTEELPIQTDRIHVENGTLYLDGRFEPVREICRNRLTVRYDPAAPLCSLWLNFLIQLLEPEDIPVLQEYLGYLLIPTNRAQKMLMILGRGGEGKSRIGLLLRAIFGSNLYVGSIQKLEKNRFARADLESMLVMVDDDMQMSALTETSTLKTIITLEGKLDLERKGQQSYQGDVYARLLAFGNGSLQSLYDHTDAFYRRQLIMVAKPVHRQENDPNLIDQLVAEKEGIFLWMLKGLRRLINQNFQFTLSPHMTNNLQQAIAEGNNVVEFLQSEGYLRFVERDASATSRELCSCYQRWCRDNAVKPQSDKTLISYLKEHSGEYNVVYTNKIPIGGGRTARGFLNVGVEDPGWDAYT